MNVDYSKGGRALVRTLLSVNNFRLTPTGSHP